MAGDTRLVTENFLRLNFTPNGGITPGTNDLLMMGISQITARYNVTVSGIQTSTRCPSQNEVVSAALIVGTAYQGGVIGHIFVSGETGYVAGQTHGLIVAPEEAATAVWWNGSNVNTGTASNSIVVGAGLANSNAIVTVQGVGTYAARICRLKTTGGYSDWYLPNIGEWDRLFPNRVAIGGYSATYYWTSTQTNNSPYANAASYNITTGQDSPGAFKNTAQKVRAVRAF